MKNHALLLLLSFITLSGCGFKSGAQSDIEDFRPEVPFHAALPDAPATITKDVVNLPSSETKDKKNP